MPVGVPLSRSYSAYVLGWDDCYFFYIALSPNAWKCRTPDKNLSRHFATVRLTEFDHLPSEGLRQWLKEWNHAISVPVYQVSNPFLI